MQPGHREMNPLARSLIDTFGLSGAVVVRVLFGVAYFANGALLLRPVVEPDRRSATRNQEALAA